MYKKQELSKLEAVGDRGNYYEGPDVGHKDLLSIAVGGRKIEIRDDFKKESTQSQLTFKNLIVI